MASDKEITELPVLPSNPTADDIFLSVRDDVDYQLTGAQLIDFIQAVLAVGSVVTFSTAVPANSAGNNGDIVVIAASGQFYQKQAGVWILSYTVPVGVVGNQILYGLGIPNNSTGNNGDTYVNTGSGVFYQKIGGGWSQQFSMASGPAGATGAAGAAGANGTNGNTVLNGIVNPSNSVGNNGDFYLNTVTYFIFGPKAAGIWPAGVSLIPNGPAFKMTYNYINTDARFVYDAVNYTLTFNLNATDKTLFPFDVNNINIGAEFRQIISSTVTKTKKSFDATITNDGNFYTSIMFEGITSDLIDNAQIILS